MSKRAELIHLRAIDAVGYSKIRVPITEAEAVAMVVPQQNKVGA
jgi:hypothetical protein